MQVGNRSWIFFAKITKLLTAKQEQDTAVNSFARRRDAMVVFPTGVHKSMSFTVFYCLGSPGKNCRLRKILSLNFTAMELSYDVLCPFLVWGLRSDDETVIGNRRLHMFESSGTRFIHSLPLFLLARRDEIMKCYFKRWPKSRALRAEASHARSDDASDLSMPVSCQFQFSEKCSSSHLETLLRFWMEMFKYSEFDLERTTAKSTIMFTLFSISAFDRRCPSLQSSKHCI